MNVQLLAEQHLECLSLKEGCTGWSEPTLVKMHNVGNYRSRLNYGISLTSNFNIKVISMYYSLLPMKNYTCNAYGFSDACRAVLVVKASSHIDENDPTSSCAY